MNRDGHLLQFLEKMNTSLKNYYSKMMDSLWNILLLEDPKWIEQYEKDESEYQNFLSSSETYKQIEKYQKSWKFLSHKRQLQVLQNDMLEFQTSSQRLNEMSTIWNKLHRKISRYKTPFMKEEYTEIELLSIFRTSNNIQVREELWRSYMNLGVLVQQDLLQLVQLRNEIAQENGYTNFFEMKLHSQELSTEFLISMIKDLREELDPIYKKVKEIVDRELSEFYGIEIKDLRPWHYNHPFFQFVIEPDLQEENIDLGCLKENIASWFEQKNINLRPIISKADLTVSKEKSQANFCLNIDRDRDIRLSCNFGFDIRGFKLLFHELGHAYYETELDDCLPFVVKQPHIFFSEAIAILFESLPLSIIDIRSLEKSNSSNNRFSSLMAFNQIVNFYWTIVVVEFEQKLYENPLQDLNDVWWNLVEDIQLIQRPDDWNSFPSWAAKAHLTTLPVYYHNYLLGDVLASQFKKHLSKLFHSWYSIDSFQYLKEKIIKFGRSKSWKEILSDFNKVGFNITDYRDQIYENLGLNVEESN